MASKTRIEFILSTLSTCPTMPHQHSNSQHALYISTPATNSLSSNSPSPTTRMPSHVWNLQPFRLIPALSTQPADDHHQSHRAFAPPWTRCSPNHRPPHQPVHQYQPHPPS